MKNLEITWTTILAVFTGLAVLIEGIKSIKYLFRPIQKLKQDVYRHEDIIIKELQRIDNVEQGSKVICNCMLAILDNQITGNRIDKLKLAKKDLQDYLIRK